MYWSVAVHDDQAGVGGQVLPDISHGLACAAVHHHHDADDLHNEYVKLPASQIAREMRIPLYGGRLVQVVECRGHDTHAGASDRSFGQPDTASAVLVQGLTESSWNSSAQMACISS